MQPILLRRGAARRSLASLLAYGLTCALLGGAARASPGPTGTSAAPIELIVKTGDNYRVMSIDYHGGLRYPHLERDPSQPARLDAILSARP